MSAQQKSAPTQQQTAPTQEKKKPISRKERRRLKEYRQLQERTTTILPATTFRRLVGETAQNFKSDIRFQSDAVKALQVASEEELTRVFHGAAVLASVAGRETVTPEDMRTYEYLRNH